MTLINLPPKFNACFANIHLVALVHGNDVKKYGYNKILKPIVNELKELEQGVSMSILGEIETVKGVLVDFGRDNLGRYQIFGCLQSFRANTFCEWCMTDLETMHKKFHETDFDLRTVESLAMDAKAAVDCPQLSCSSSGVRGETVLS